MRKIQIKTPADNERFGVIGGVCPLTVLCGFASLSPAGSSVETATTL